MVDINIANSGNEYSIVPSTGTKETDFHTWADGAIPASFSAGGWTHGNEGFAHQTFLGASIVDFTVNGGFGTSSSSLSVNLVNDEYNASDRLGLGQGDDVYHDGDKDLFRPPQVGSPVFFKFGKNHCTVDEAWRPTFDKIYGHTTITTSATPRQTSDGSTSGIPGVTTIPNTAVDESGIQLDPNIEVMFSGVKGRDSILYSGLDEDNEFVDSSKVLDPKNRARGKEHFIFGGILQSYTQNRGGGGNPVFSVNVTDPREILSNVVLLLDNYAGTTYNNSNMLNLYGFLEHNPSDSLMGTLKSVYDNIVTPEGDPNLPPSYVQPVLRTDNMIINGQKTGSLTNYVYGGHLRKIVNVSSLSRVATAQSSVRPLGSVAAGEIEYLGNDMWAKAGREGSILTTGGYPAQFPITGVGMSRKTDEGMPFYRIAQAIRALFNYDGKLPQEYIDAGYGGFINFRGFNYVVDLSAFPADKIPPYYRLNFDKMTLMELCQELADVISHDLFVSLLPVLDHPATAFLNRYNGKVKAKDSSGNYIDPDWRDKIITGVIRVETIDRSKKPDYGSIQKFIDEQTERGEHVQNNDVGYELSNVVTDKFVVGAQESKLYFFSNNRDRDFLDVRKFKQGITPNGAVGDAGAVNAIGDQWKHWKSLQQQILPFYGFLGDGAVTIPRGWGAYQQIMLDASELNAFGVGNYYVATELELRAASVSYDRWKDFLVKYNDEYMQSLEEDDALDRALLKRTPAIPGQNQLSGILMNSGISQNYGVSVPRCVYTSDRNYFTRDGLPASPCSPPLGYPLYYKRATKLGVPEAGLTRIANSMNNLITDIGRLKAERNSAEQEIQAAQHELERILADVEFFIAGQRPINDPALEAGDEAIDDQFGMGEGDEEAFEAMEQALEAVINKSPKPWSFSHGLKELIGEITEFAKGMNDRIEALQDTQYSTVASGLQTTVDRRNAISAQIGLIKKATTGGADLITLITQLHERAEKNAKKVHEYLKKVADENLGKKFLVKIPKDTNIYYREEIGFENYGSATSYVGEITTGPFGFRPEPISASNPTQYFTKAFQTQIRSSLVNGSPPRPFDYLRTRTVDKQFLLGLGNQGVTIPQRLPDYSDGALKCNFDMVEDKWVFNYEIDSKGGWFDYQMCQAPIRAEDLNTMTTNLGFNSTPYVTRNILFPQDMFHFIEEDGRVKAFARYNHSQFLSFKGISKDKMVQQRVTNNGHLIPIFLEELDNIMPDKAQSLVSQRRNLPEMTAFVKVDVDEKFYMAPRTSQGIAPVYGTNVVDIGSYEMPEMVLDTGDCKYKPTYGFYNPIYVPDPDKGGYGGVNIDHVDFQRTYVPGLDGEMINTQPHNLDPDAVYALITVPGKVKPTQDSRMVDGPFQVYGTTTMKNLLTQDVVKNFPGFEKPTMKGNPVGIVGEICNQLSAQSLNQALNAAKNKFKATMLDDPLRSLGLVTESPIYPDIVALPLMSKERCYGPWVSSAIDVQRGITYQNIGGKVEFSKDEKLAPWNFGGYDLLNKAGSLQAEFSNSLLLYSERGGIVFAGAPRGNSLCQQLTNGGPLVTSISVNVANGGISTTYKMDLYTSRFGKLDNQRKGEIDRMSRERQKIRDNQNKLIRKGLDKGATRGDFSFSNNLNEMVNIASQTTSFMNELNDQTRPPNDIIVASVNVETNSSSVATDGGNSTGAGTGSTMNFNASAQGAVSTPSAAESATNTRPNAGYSTSYMNVNKFKTNASVYNTAEEFNTAYYNSAGGSVSENLVPMSEDAYHPNMPNKGRRKTNVSLYLSDNVGVVKTVVPGLPEGGARSSSDAPAAAGMLGGQGGGEATGAGVPDDIMSQVDALTAGMVGDIATIGVSSGGTLLGLSSGSQAGFGNVKDKTDQLGDLFG